MSQALSLSQVALGVPFHFAFTDTCTNHTQICWRIQHPTMSDKTIPVIVRDMDGKGRWDLTASFGSPTDQVVLADPASLDPMDC